VKETSHIHLVLRLRINGATFLFPLHTLTECRGKKLPYQYGVRTRPGTYPELIGRKKALRVRVNEVLEELRWSISDKMSLKVYVH
jgi:hypothetical protein